MKLQVAIDLLTTEAALELAGQVAEYVDIIELGTPLIKAEGLSVITAVKDAHPDKIVFADLKTMDAGELEADIAFKAGADLSPCSAPLTTPPSPVRSRRPRPTTRASSWT